MKSVSEIVACVVEYGTFVSLAEKLAETMGKVYYYSPSEAEYLDIITCMRGEGLKGVERIDDYLDPAILDEVDLFIFPDRGYGGIQRHLRDDLNKAVWGSVGVCAIEEFRTLFIDLLHRFDMPMVPSVKVRGLTLLAQHLEGVENKWIKVDRYRACMETWKHRDWEHSQRELERLAKWFGPTKDEIDFVVQDHIETDVEVGYDGWCVDGEFPSASFQGYEAKDELYIGHLLPSNQLPEAVQYVNERLAPLLRTMGYRNFWSTEIRVSDGEAYFIDPTPRMPGQTGEQMLETCSNLADVIWHGANGDLIEPTFDYEYAVEATLHYTAGPKDNWKTIAIPKEVQRWLKPYHYCRLDGMVHVVPSNHTDDVGVMLGVGATMEEAIDHLKENLEAVENEPLHADLHALAELLEKVKTAEKEGVHFSDDKLPEPSIVL